MMLCAGNAPVYFLDLNEEVLSATTAPNVAVNCSNVPAKLQNARFVSGDWLEASELLSEGQGQGQGSPLMFRVILSSETIYTHEVTLKLCDMLRRHLRYPDGEAFIAAKRYYFGTGGSVAHFKEAIASASASPSAPASAAASAGSSGGSSGGGSGGGSGGAPMIAETVWVAEDGRSNIREIVRVAYRR